ARGAKTLVRQRFLDTDGRLSTPVDVGGNRADLPWHARGQGFESPQLHSYCRRSRPLRRFFSTILPLTWAPYWAPFALAEAGSPRTIAPCGVRGWPSCQSVTAGTRNRFEPRNVRSRWRSVVSCKVRGQPAKRCRRITVFLQLQTAAYGVVPPEKGAPTPGGVPAEGVIDDEPCVLVAMKQMQCEG